MHFFAAHSAVISCEGHHHHFLCPLLSDQSSTSSHGAITAVCASLFMCVCLLFSQSLVAHTVMQNIGRVLTHARAHRQNKCFPLLRCKMPIS